MTDEQAPELILGLLQNLMLSRRSVGNDGRNEASLLARVVVG